MANGHGEGGCCRVGWFSLPKTPLKSSSFPRTWESSRLSQIVLDSAPAYDPPGDVLSLE